MNLPCEPILSEFERKNIMERETMQHLWIETFFPIILVLADKVMLKCMLKCSSTAGRTFENQGHWHCAYCFQICEKCKWLYISTLTPTSTCLFLWSLKRDKKITLEIREQHGKLKLNVQSARKLILTTKPCKDTFGISILRKWRLLYPQADTSREPV